MSKFRHCGARCAAFLLFLFLLSTSVLAQSQPSNPGSKASQERTLLPWAMRLVVDAPSDASGGKMESQDCARHKRYDLFSVLRNERENKRRLM